MSNIIIAFLIVIANIMPLLFFVIIYFAIKRTAKKAREEGLSKVDFAQDVDYYRDILDNYSIAELSFVDDFKIKGRREIIATLMCLKLKGKIDLLENKIVILDSNLLGLKKSEKYVMQNIIDGKVKLENEDYFHFSVYDEAIEDGLVEKTTKKETKKKLLKRNRKKLLTILFCIIAFALFCNNIELLNEWLEKIDSELVSMLVFMLLFILSFAFMMIFMISPFTGITYLIMQTNSHKRTEKGEELNKKIEGLKQYIRDYSLLSQAEKESLEIWEEYLIYSIIFDMNLNGIVDELSQLVEIKYEIGKIYVERTK